MDTSINYIYNETAIREAEKRTDRYNSTKRMKEINHFINSRILKDLDFPLDEDELDDNIEEF